MKTKSILALAIIAIISLVGQANAAIVIRFKETDGNVVATTTGSFQVPSIPYTSTTSSTFSAANSFQFYYVHGNHGLWIGGTPVASDLSISPTTAEGDTFGYSVATLLLPSGLTHGSTYTPNTTWTWSGQTLADIGLGHLTKTPVLVFTGPASSGFDTISIATISLSSVPEPTTTALFIGGVAAAFTALRRRRK